MLQSNAPSKFAADGILIFLKLFFRENNTWCFIWIICLTVIQNFFHLKLLPVEWFLFDKQYI